MKENIKNIDCSDCKNCYPHEICFGEFWCKIKEEEQEDGMVYDIHNLRDRFRKECESFKSKKLKRQF